MALKLRALVKFPALVQAAVGMAVTIANGIYTFAYDWMNIDTVDAVADPSSRYILLVSGTVDEQLYERIAVDDFLSSVAVVRQVIETAGAHDVETTATLVVVQPDPAGAVTLNLPVAGTKVGPVKIVDQSGDAHNNAITIDLAGAEEFQAGLTSWTINTQGGSAVFTPNGNDGYSV